MDSEFRYELQKLINGHSIENGSNTPDWILANYLVRCIEAFDIGVRERERWYGRTTALPTYISEESNK